jgi:L-2-hydroxyglutarate oxidase LhgO
VRDRVGGAVEAEQQRVAEVVVEAWRARPQLDRALLQRQRAREIAAHRQEGAERCTGVRRVGLAADQFLELAERLGVEIRTGVEVRRIRVDGGRTRGVELASGESLDARVVVSNM